MPFNGSGVFSLAEPPFTPGTTIVAADMNSDLSDIATGLSTCLTTDGQSTMTAQIKGFVGTVSLPGYSFSVDPNTGFYRSASDEISLSAGGTQIWKSNSSGLDIITGNLLLAGVAAFPVQTANIGNSQVTYAKIQNVTASRLLGRGSSDAGAPEEITLSTGLNLSGTTLTAPATPIAPSFSSLVAVNNTVTPNTRWNINADRAILTDGTNYYQASNVNLTIDATTTGANGLDAGSLANNTWYAYFVIYNGTTVAGLMSTSATSPTMPSGYTYKARAGWVRTDGSANFKRIVQKGARAQYVTTQFMAQGGAGTYHATTPTWASQSVSSFVPTTASEIYIIATVVYNNQNGSHIYVAPNNTYSGYQGTLPPPLSQFHPGGSTSCNMVLESTNIYWATSSTGGAIFTQGWIDNL